MPDKFIDTIDDHLNEILLDDSDQVQATVEENNNLDNQLVDVLLHDGRASARSLAEELDVSVTTVSNRLRSLSETGVINGFTPIVAYDKFGYDVTAILKLKVAGDALPEVTDSLYDRTQIVSVYETIGDYDVLAIGKFTDIDDMTEQVRAISGDSNIDQLITNIAHDTIVENKPLEVGASNKK
jgi:DNA-binding Lrp family transcriptional regulator